MSVATASDQEVLERLQSSNSYWAATVAKIVNKQRKLVAFNFNEGQRVLDDALLEQSNQGAPQRAIALKARQIGVSSYVQARAIKQTTMWAHQAALVIAHDKETSRKLFTIGERMYQKLPEIPELKPERLSHRRGQYLHFDTEDGQGLDSTYLVDTAGERESGRGGTYTLIHASEMAFWPDIETKMTALSEAVPDEPDTLIVLESTANGANEFKDLWTDAVDGRSDFYPFFWPWWKQAEYTIPFANDAERTRFQRTLGEDRYGGSEEVGLYEPGPIDTATGEPHPITLEQLHWRRRKLDSPAFAGKIDKFKQEHPATPEEAFISSGRQRFEPSLVQVIVNATAITDPRQPTVENPGPAVGQFRAKTTRTVESIKGNYTIPQEALWVPRSDLEAMDEAPWKLWLEAPEITDGKPTGQFILASDVSGRVEESDGDQPAWDTIQVIGHESRLQVAEWRGRADEDQLAEQILLACLFFNKPWAAPEITGGYGGPVARKLFQHYKYPYTYKRKKLTGQTDSQLDNLGWDTNKSTKPMLDANMAEMIRDGSHGIRSRVLALELTTYIKDSRGRTRPEKGKFSDLLMAYSIAQMVADIQPIKRGSHRKGFDRPVSY